MIVDSSSIEVPRRARRAKTNRIEGKKLLAMLLRVAGGERGVWKVVHVPSEVAGSSAACRAHAARGEARRTRGDESHSQFARDARGHGGRARFCGSDVTRVRRGGMGQSLLPGLHRRLAREGEHFDGVDGSSCGHCRRRAAGRGAGCQHRHGRRSRRAAAAIEEMAGWNAAWLYASGDLQLAQHPQRA